jgi:hypothetical protein
MTTGGEQARFVATAAIRQAVAGRETDVLDAIGVDWRAGRPHIICPYPGHDDGDPSWRWDAHKGRAFCTCTKSDSVFDVVMKVEDSTFEAAKVHVAELIGRTELIHSKRGERHQATDAASLLKPPHDNRDDSLPIAYLAHRLGVAVEAVPIPSTPVVGPESSGLLRCATAGMEGEMETGRRLPVRRVRHGRGRWPDACASHLSCAGGCRQSRPRYQR